MTYLLYLFGSGWALFLGVAMQMAALALFLRCERKWLRSLASLIACVGLVVVALSAVPLPYWFYALALVVSLAWLAVERSASERWQSKRRPLRYGVLAVWTLGLAMELPYHLPPRLTPVENRTVYVIGDSVTAGLGGKGEQLWPALLAAGHSLDVQSFAQMGATAGSAMKQARSVPADAELVLVEIGGNDLLGTTTLADFERDLDQLLADLVAPQRQVVLFELPLPPLCNEYGRIQRRVAARHGVRLIPKRALISVIATSEGTLDSIHLSPEGHARLADTVWGIFGPPSPRRTGCLACPRSVR